VDENTAFVKYGGKYGILDVEKTALAMANGNLSPATGDNSTVYVFTLLSMSALLIMQYKLRNTIY